MTFTEADLEMAVKVPKPTAKNPFALGFRYRDGGSTELPLTAEDLVWQEEGDQIMTNENHNRDMSHLHNVIKWRIENRPGLRVLTEHCIDFEVPGLGIIGPDVILFNGEDRAWSGDRGTFPVKTMAARPLYAFEVTSPSTRGRDFRERLQQYYRAGVSFYVIIDARYGGGKKPQGIVVFQAGPSEYERLPAEPDGRAWIEVAEIWVGLEDDQLVCWLPDGTRLHSDTDLRQAAIKAEEEAEKAREQAKKAQQKARKAQQKAKEAQERAEAAEADRLEEKKRADAEKKRADAAAAKLARLEAELRRVRGSQS